MKTIILFVVSLFTVAAQAQVYTSSTSYHAQVNCYARDQYGRPYILT